MDKRKQAQQLRGRSVKTVPLKEGSLQWVGVAANPGERTEGEEAVFRHLVEEAPQDVRRRLKGLKSSQQSDLIRYLESVRPSGNTELLLATVEQWFDQEADNKRRSR
jgi:hypothetical protein